MTYLDQSTKIMSIIYTHTHTHTLKHKHKHIHSYLLLDLTIFVRNEIDFMYERV